MATPKELRQAIVDARAELQASFHGAHATWQTKPQGTADGENAWSPMEVAQHIIGAELFFASAISQACGAPALEMQRPDVSTPAAAAASLTKFAAIADNIFRHVSDADLAKTTTTPRGESSVEQMMTLMAAHILNHANQIRAASE